MHNKSVRIFHILTSLEHGGAQFIASKLILDDNKSFNHIVFALVDLGPYKPILINKGIEVISTKSSNFFSILRAAINCYIGNRPDIVHTWMYHADLIGLILSIFFKKHKLIWSLHHANPVENKFLTRVIIRVCKFFSAYIPDKIVACSQLASQNHIQYGYSMNNMIVIENGINFENYSNKTKTLENYNFNKNKIVIGHIARWHPIKGHKVFIEMASNLYKKNKKYSFILVGTGINWGNKELVKLLTNYELIDAVELLGERKDINIILNNLDIYISTSINESFSLTLVEAIACRVLSISSDTGIARDALSDKLCIVDIGDPSQLIETVKTLVSLPVDNILEIVNDSYEKIHGRFEENIMFDKYHNLYLSILKNNDK
jgi:glycosyltransferase involved in cell wall biosynthesis